MLVAKFRNSVCLLVSLLFLPSMSLSIEISGYVKDQMQGPVAATVYINDDFSFETDANGYFAGEVPAGQLAIYAEATRENATLKSLRRNFYATNNTEVRLTVSPLRSVTILAELPSNAYGPWLRIFEAVTPSDEILKGDLQAGPMVVTSLGQISYTKTYELPEGIYRAQVRANWPEQEDNVFISWIGFEVKENDNFFKLTTEDRYTLYPLAERSVDPSKVTFKNDIETGYIKIIGGKKSASAAMPLSLLNLQTGHYTWGSSHADGSFELLINGQEGSEYVIYQRGMVDGWQNYQLGAGAHLRIPFTSNSANKFSTEHALSSSNNSPTKKSDADLLGGKTTGIAQFFGTFDFSALNAGAAGVFEGTVRIIGPSVDTLKLNWGSSDLYLEKIVDKEGWVIAATPENSSNFMTVSGLPINGEPTVNDTRVGSVTYSEISRVAENNYEAKFTATYNIPAELSDGRYQIHLKAGSLTSDISAETVFTHNFALDASTSVLDGRVGEFQVGLSEESKIDIALLANTYSNGSRGTVPTSRKNSFGITPGIIFNTHKFILDDTVPFKSERVTFNLEPYIPLVSWTTKGHQVPLPIQFKFPSGELLITIVDPNGTRTQLGPAPFQGTYMNEPFANWGAVGGNGGAAPQQYLKLSTLTDLYEYPFDNYGEYSISLSGSVLDIQDRKYALNGDFQVVKAEPLDLEYGVMPGTPFEVGDYFSPQLLTQPGVPAKVNITVTHYPYSDPALIETTDFEGFANRFGYFDGGDKSYIFNEPGEYRVDVYASHMDTDEKLWAGSRTWGGIVETPGSDLEMRGVKGTEAYTNYRQWFNFNARPLGPGESNTHMGPPYQTGDISWMTAEELDRSNSAMTGFYTIFDKEGTFRASVANRLSEYSGLDLTNTGLPFVSTTNLITPDNSSINPFFELKGSDDHWAYYYNAAERPGVAAREHIGQLASRDNYWRFSDTYNYQLGNGKQGDNPNDFKFVFGGGVYRIPKIGENHYLAYGSLWVHLPGEDEVGGRIMPPFQGAASGPSGGPIMTLLGKDIDIFYHPLGVRPGTILEVGDLAAFSGQIAPTLPSDISIKITTPSGSVKVIEGTANKIGYFYKPGSNFLITEPGVYDVNILVTHKGMTSSGLVNPPYPSGGILGPEQNTFQFYAVTDKSNIAKLNPLPSVLPRSTELKFTLNNSDGTNSNQFYQTTVMPGFLLEQSNSSSNDYFYNAKNLNLSFPNLDVADDTNSYTANADTVTYSFLLKSQDKTGNITYEANQVLLQGDTIFNPDHKLAVTGSMNISIADTTLTAGEVLKVDLSLSAQGLGDLYIALIMPDGNFVTLGETRLASGISEIIPFRQSISLEDNRNIQVVDVSIPAGVMTGDYSFYAIFVSEGESVLDESNWKGTSSASWELN